MDKISTFIKENKLVVILFILTVLIAVGLFIYNKSNVENLDKNLTEEEATDVPYIKKNYEVNEYHNVSIDLIDLLNDYYHDYVNKIINNPKEAYEMLTSEAKEDFGNNYDDFKEYIDKINTVTFRTGSVKEYRTNKGRIPSYDIIDDAGNRFTIYEKSVWDYEISFEGRN